MTMKRVKVVSKVKVIQLNGQNFINIFLFPLIMLERLPSVSCDGVVNDNVLMLI